MYAIIIIMISVIIPLSAIGYTNCFLYKKIMLILFKIIIYFF